MEKKTIIARLNKLKALVENSESSMKLAIISYRQYQEDLALVMTELDELEKEIKAMKSRSIFNLWFGDPVKQLDDMLFNEQVHDAIEDADGHRN